MNTQMKESDLATEITSQFRFAKLYLDPVHKKMNGQEELYRSYINGTNYEHNARVFDPRTFRVIETIVPRMVSQEPEGTFFPEEYSDTPTSQIFKALIRYDWRKAHMFEKQVLGVKSMLIFGTMFGRTYWDFQEVDKVRMVPKQINGRSIWTPSHTETIKVTKFDGPNFEPLNIYDCFPDPVASSMDNLRWFIFRTFKTLDELERENEIRGNQHYKNLDKVKELIGKREGSKGGATYKPDDLYYKEHRRTMLSTQDLTGQDESNPEVVILRRFTADRWTDVVVSGSAGVVIRDIDNPYFHGRIPIIHGVDYPYPGELYGMGEIEPVDRVQRAINAILNQRLDNVQLNLDTMWKVKKSSGVDMHTLFTAPGNIITTEDMNAIEPISVPDVTGNTFVQTMNYLTSSLQNGSGITDYTIGINSNSSTVAETATGTRLIQQEANAQFKLKIQLYNHMVIEHIANDWKDLRTQFTTSEQLLRIVGREQVRFLTENTELARTNMDGTPAIPGDSAPRKLVVSNDLEFAFLNLYPEDIQPSIVGNYDFVSKATTGQVDDPAAQREALDAIITQSSTPAYAQGLAAQGKMLNYEFILKQRLDALNAGVDTTKILENLPKPPEAPQEMPQEMPEGMPDMGQGMPEMMQGMEAPPEAPNMNAGGVQGLPPLPGIEGLIGGE